MKVFHGILFTLDALVVVCLGLAALVRNQAPDWFTSLDLSVMTRPTFLLTFGLCAIVLHLGWVCAWLVLHSERRRYITAGRADGPVYVAVSAIEEALERSLQTLREVSRIRVRITPGQATSDPVTIGVQGVLWDDIDMTGATVRARELVEQRYGEIVPGDTDPVIKLHWEKLRPRQRRKPKVKKGDTRPPFRGPQYPVSK